MLWILSQRYKNCLLSARVYHEIYPERRQLNITAFEKGRNMSSMMQLHIKKSRLFMLLLTAYITLMLRYFKSVLLERQSFRMILSHYFPKFHQQFNELHHLNTCNTYTHAHRIIVYQILLKTTNMYHT